MVKRGVRMLSRVRDLTRRRDAIVQRHASASPARPHAPRPAPAPRLDPELERREAEARYHRERLALYRARVLSGRPSSLARLRELERVSAAATERLTHLSRR
jgi:hypothetical protein